MPDADLPLLRHLLRVGDVTQLTSQIAAWTGPDAHLAPLASYAVTGRATSLAPRNDLEAAFMRQIIALRTARARYAGPPRHRLVAPRTVDALADDQGPAGWSAAQWLNMLLLAKIQPRQRCAVVVSMRDDGLSVLEWVAHYRALGCTGIFIYSNDNVDGSDVLLDCLAFHGVITHIQNDCGPGYSPQRKAFAHALHLLPELRDYEWVFFADSDEFFVPGPGYGPGLTDLIDAFEAQSPPGEPAALCFQWRWYVSAGAYARTPGLLLERFRHATDHGLSKSLVRLSDVVSMRRLHFPDLRAGATLLRGDGVKLREASLWEARAPDYGAGQINHYWTKSFEEFSIKKARGDAVSLAQNDFARDFELFFKWNSDETAENLAPPPAALVAEVAVDVGRLMALDGVAEAVRTIEGRLPAMLARFDTAGGLRAIYDGLAPAG